MRILAVWDNLTEAELISTYLSIDGNEVTLTKTAEEFRSAIEAGHPADILLMPTGFPDSETSFRLFELARERYPDAPIVGACPPSDVFRVVKFMANGMNAYLTRDERRDYMFMLLAIMENALVAVRTAREKELTKKLRDEVESVRKLQESVLPKKLQVPDGYRICARYEPAPLRVVGGQPVAMAGGDYYDVFPLSDGRVALLVGDATGHGMKSCLSIMTLHTLARMMRRQDYPDTAAFTSEINCALCDQSLVTEKGGFITLLFAILNAEAQTLQWSAAGHQPPLLQNLSTGVIKPLASQNAGGLPLAVDEDEEYANYACELPDNFRLLLYTDGLEEAFPEGDDKNHFGINGIIKTLTDSKDLSLEETLERLFAASDEHTQGSGRKDDTSVLLLEHRT